MSPLMRQFYIDPRSRILGSVVILVLIASAALNVWFAYRLGSLSSELRIVRSPSTTLAGKTLPPLTGHRVNVRGSSTVQTAEEAPQELRLDNNGCNVLYVFSEDCEWCKKNLSNVAKMRRDLDTVGARVVAISFDPNQDKLQRYVQKAMPEFEVFAALADGSRKTLRVPGTPWTVAVDSRGTVLAEWPGMYDDKTVDTIISLCAGQLAKG